MMQNKLGEVVVVRRGGIKLLQEIQHIFLSLSCAGPLKISCLGALLYEGKIVLKFTANKNISREMIKLSPVPTIYPNPLKTSNIK